MIQIPRFTAVGTGITGATSTRARRNRRPRNYQANPPRSRVRLGSTPSEMPEKRVIYIRLVTDGETWKLLSQLGYRVKPMRDIVRSQIIVPVQEAIRVHVERLVPHDSGALQKSMIDKSRESIDMRKLTTVGVEINLGTPGIDYAIFVNRMPESWFFSPTAEHNWYKKVLKAVWSDSRVIVRRFKDQLSRQIAMIGRRGHFKPRTMVERIFDIKIPTRM